MCETRYCTSMTEVRYSWTGAKAMCRHCRSLFGYLEEDDLVDLGR